MTERDRTGRVGPVRALGGALSWLTVIPVPAPHTIDRRFGGAVITAVPVVGALLGATAAALAWALSQTALPATLIGVLTVAALALLTRGMHLDGLADTADGLGCYGSPERVADVMRSGSTGPFGVATVVVVMLIEAVGIGALGEQHRWAGIAVAVLLGRVAVIVACRRRLRPAHPDGFGALVAGTQWRSMWVWIPIAIVCAGLAGAADSGPGGAVRAALTALVVLGFAWMFTRHCARRMGGIPGDVLGAVIELGTAIALVGLLI